MVWCWWCCHPFEGPELHMPFKYDDLRKRFKTLGIFCSWPCMKAYNIDRAGPRYGEYQMFITLMRKHVYGRLEPCRVAPKRQCLKVFGGTMGIDEFRAGKDPPMINMPNEMHMLCLTGPSTVAEPTAVSNTGELKLKREKPLKRAESSLEKSLGIKRKNI
jgi:hypothetical protein